MKRYSVLALLFVSIFAFTSVLTGCGGGEEECVNRASEGVVYNFDEQFRDVVELRVWLDDEDYFNALKVAFEAANPDIILNFTEVGSVDVRQRLELYSGSTQAADVVVYPHDHIGAALQSGLLAAIEGTQATDIRTRMIDSAWQTASTCYDFATNAIIDCVGDDPGTLFGAPLVGESVALFYNKALLREWTGSDTPPTTFEQIIAQAALYADKLDGEPIIGLDVGNAYDMHFVTTAFGFELFGPEGLDANQPNLASPAVVNGLTWFNQTLRPAVDPGRVLNASELNGDANKSRFESGLIPYMITGPWNISDFLAAGIELGVTLIPTINGEQPTSFSGVQLASVYRQSRNPDAAFRLLEFMTSPEGLAILYAEKNVLPALKDVSVVEGVAEDAYLSGISEQLNFSVPMPIIPEMGFFWSNAGSMYSQAWNGTRSPERAAAIANNGFVEQSGFGTSVEIPE